MNKKIDISVIGFSYTCPECSSKKTYFSAANGWECENGHHFVPDVLKGSGIERGSLSAHLKQLPIIKDEWETIDEPDEPTFDYNEFLRITHELSLPTEVISSVEFVKSAQESLCRGVTMEEAISWNLK